MAAHPVQGARGDQRLDDPLVAQAQINPSGEIGEGLEGLLSTCYNHRFDRSPAHIAHRAKAKANPPVADDRELESRFVHVRRQHLEVQFPGLVDVLDHLVGAADFGGEQRRHEFGGGSRS